MDEGMAQDLDGTWIIGGGLAGLATAAALLRITGLERVIVLEKATKREHLDDTAGAAVQVGPNGFRALKTIGGEELVQQIIEKGSTLTGMVISSKDPSVITPIANSSDTEYPQVLIRWGLLRALLAELLPPNTIHHGFGADIQGYQRFDSTDFVVPVNQDGKIVGPSGNHPPLVLIAADGIYSKFHRLVRMNIPLLPPVEADVLLHGNIQDNGRTNVKAVVAKGIAKSVPGTAYSYFSPDGSLACFAAPAGDGQTYWAVTISDQRDESGSVTRYFVEATTGSTAVKNLILSKLRSLDAPECQFAVELIEATDQEAMYVRRSEQFMHLGPAFVSQDNKVVLVGDAAHAMMSSYGQSANFAFEDATTLAICLRDVSDMKKALGLYSISRLDRCIEMKRRSVERVEKGMKGLKLEDDSEDWITSWTVESVEDVYRALDESTKQLVQIKKADHANT